MCGQGTAWIRPLVFMDVTCLHLIYIPAKILNVFGYYKMGSIACAEGIYECNAYLLVVQVHSTNEIIFHVIEITAKWCIHLKDKSTHSFTNLLTDSSLFLGHANT